METTREVVLFLFLILAVGSLPLVGSAGIAIGRMQVSDEIDRGESPKYVRRNAPVRVLALGGRR